MGKIYKNGIEYGGGGSAGHTILDNDGNSMPAEDNLQFKGLDVTDNSTDGVTEVESIGLNQDSLNDVTDGSIGNEIINNGMTYSTNEQVVGKWIDGKPLYQKTVITAVPNNTQVSYPHGIANIDNVVSLTGGILVISDGYLLPANITGTDVNANAYRVSAGRSDIIIKTYFNGSSSNYAGYFTIQYTKTTD